MHKIEQSYSSPTPKNATPRQRQKSNKRYQEDLSEDNIKDMNLSDLNMLCPQIATENQENLLDNTEHQILSIFSNPSTFNYRSNTCKHSWTEEDQQEKHKKAKLLEESFLPADNLNTSFSPLITQLNVAPEKFTPHAEDKKFCFTTSSHSRSSSQDSQTITFTNFVEQNYENNHLKQQIVKLGLDLDQRRSIYMESQEQVKFLQTELLNRELECAKIQARSAYPDTIRESELIVCKAEISKMKIKNGKMIQVYRQALELDSKLGTKFICDQLVYFLAIISLTVILVVQYVN